MSITYLTKIDYSSYFTYALQSKTGREQQIPARKKTTLLSA